MLRGNRSCLPAKGELGSGVNRDRRAQCPADVPAGWPRPGSGWVPKGRDGSLQAPSCCARLSPTRCPPGPAQALSQISASRSPRPGFCTFHSATAPLKAVALFPKACRCWQQSRAKDTRRLCPGGPPGCCDAFCTGDTVQQQASSVTSAPQLQPPQFGKSGCSFHTSTATRLLLCSTHCFEKHTKVKVRTWLEGSSQQHQGLSA